MRRWTLSVMLLAAAFMLGGCNNCGNLSAGSPAPFAAPLAGKWTGKAEVKGGGLTKLANSLAGGPLTGPSYLKLKPDRTGFLKVADQTERPISWKEEGDHVILQERQIGDRIPGKSAQEGPWVGQLSKDRHSMTIDMGNVKVVLHNQAGD